jgi:hypothetical protein
VRWSRAQFDVYDFESVSIMPPDAYISICQCELCKAQFPHRLLLFWEVGPRAPSTDDEDTQCGGDRLDVRELGVAAVSAPMPSVTGFSGGGSKGGSPVLP